MFLDTLFRTIQYIIVIFDLAYGCARSGSLPHPTETPSPETPSRHPGREQRERRKRRTRQRVETESVCVTLAMQVPGSLLYTPRY